MTLLLWARFVLLAALVGLVASIVASIAASVVAHAAGSAWTGVKPPR